MVRTLRSRKSRTDLFLTAEGNCQICGKPLEPDWQADHELAWRYGGGTDLENLQATCKLCNLKKGAKMAGQLTSYDFEKMRYFSEAFPNAKDVRLCQKGAYNAAVQKLAVEGEMSFSAFLPTGTGKSDLVRMLSLGLVDKLKKFAGAWVFSPSTELRDQIVRDEVEACLDRLGWQSRSGLNPFMKEDGLDNERFRNGVVLESYTTQFLTNGNDNKRNADHFVQHAKLLCKKTGKMPLAIFDESHLFSTDNEWGAAAKKMQDSGIPICLITGTPYRSDNLKIPGFKTKLVEQYQRKFVKTRKSDDPLCVKVETGILECCKYELEADYEYTYERAWEDAVILRPKPTFVDATETTYDYILSEMPRGQSNRLLRRFLMDDRTITACVQSCIESLRLRKVMDSKCAALVTTLSDMEDEEVDAEIADFHANKLKREFARQAPDIRVLVVTSKSFEQDGLSRFKNGNYDVLIVKAMGTIGFNCPKIKTVVNLSNFRTLPATIQLANRGCRHFAGCQNYDLIMPKDKGMTELWDKFQVCTGLEIEESSTIESEVTEVEVVSGDGDEKRDLVFENHELSFDPLSKRNRNDEIIQLFGRKLPVLANKMSHQEILNHHTHVSSTLGPDWLDKVSDVYLAKSTLIDCNEEETRLRAEANNAHREVVKEILLVMGRKYEKRLYADISRKTWTCIKRRCGFRPNQSLENISGIENFQKIIQAGKYLMAESLKLAPDNDFDYTHYLNQF